MFSLTKTGTWRRPSWTAMVCPIICGKITLARDQVFRTLRSLRLFMSSMRPSRRASTNGPFLMERLIYRLLTPSVPTADDQIVALVLLDAGAQAHGRTSPLGLRRHAGRLLALATAVRMVARVHRRSAHLGPSTHVARTAGLADLLVLMVEVAHLADGRHALDAHPAHLARRQADGGEVALLGKQLGAAAGAPHDLPAATGDQLDVVDLGAERDAAHGQRIADPGLDVGSAGDAVADLQAVRQQHVALVAVGVVQQADASGAVRVVLDRRDPRRHAVLLALPVDHAIEPLVAAPLVANGQLALAVATGAAHELLGERLVRSVGGDLLERRAGHLAKPGRRRSIVAKWHRHTASKSSILSPAAIVTMAFFQPGTTPSVLRPRRFCLERTLTTRTSRTVTLNSASTAALMRNLFASRATANV